MQVIERVHKIVLGLVFGIIAFPSLGHHGWSGNTAGDVSITGVVEQSVKLRGAHGTMQIRDSEGQLWFITLAPGPRTHRAGLRESTIPMGATITVHGSRNADMNEFEAKVRQVEWDDKVFDVYPKK